MPHPIKARSMTINEVSVRPENASSAKRFSGRVREFWRHPRRAIIMLFYLPCALMLKLTPWRFLGVTFPGRIGHLALEVDWFLKKRSLGDFGSIRPILCVRDSNHAPNKALLIVFGQYISVIANPLMIMLIHPLTRFSMLKIELSPADAVYPADYPRLADAWGDRPPFLILPNDIRVRGERSLREMGLPAGAWFVCVHAREDLYAPIDEGRLKGARNCDIANYEKAVDEIVARGGWCLRMGEPGAKPLKPRAGVVNYHDSQFKSDWMDVFLCANARFFLGNTSGLYAVSVVAGRPCALANMIPAGCAFGFGTRDISIVKHLRDGSGRNMTFNEMLQMELSRPYYYVETDGLTVIENSPDEVRDLAVEMLDVFDGLIEYSQEDADLQSTFRSLLNHRHYSYLSKGRIGRNFLRQNAHLLKVTGVA
jgi:putative glycosyltransferase (TIGR04372 family)